MTFGTNLYYGQLYGVFHFWVCCISTACLPRDIDWFFIWNFFNDLLATVCWIVIFGMKLVCCPACQVNCVSTSCLLSCLSGPFCIYFLFAGTGWFMTQGLFKIAPQILTYMYNTYNYQKTSISLPKLQDVSHFMLQKLYGHHELAEKYSNLTKQTHLFFLEYWIPLLCLLPNVTHYEQLRSVMKTSGCWT